MGEFGEARDLDTASVRHWTDGYGSDHHETLHVISNLVRDFYGLGRYGEALTVQQEAIVTQEAAVGATHLSVLSARRAIAVLLRKLGRYQEARRRAEENHAAHVARLPEHHELTLAATMSLCNALRDEHKDLSSLWRARELADGALQLYERYYNEPPFVEVCRTNLAILMRRLGEVARATELNAEAVERLRANLGAHHPYTLCSSTNLASDLAAAGDYAGACEISTRVYEFSADEAIRGIDHPYTLGCALNYSLDLQGAGRLNEGESLWRETVARFDRILGADHPDSIAARNRQRIDADIEPPPT
jgi:tetratricopeptide (TPR) repeat protein